MCEEVNRVVAIILYPLSSQSDQHWFSPNKINISSRETVRRILKEVTKGKILSTNFLRKYINPWHGGIIHSTLPKIICCYIYVYSWLLITWSLANSNLMLIQTLDNLNLMLTPTLNKSNLPPTWSNFCLPLANFCIIEGKKQCTEVRNIESISKHPCQYLSLLFCHCSSNSVSIPVYFVKFFLLFINQGLLLNQSISLAALGVKCAWYLHSLPIHLFCLFPYSGYLLRTPDNSNSW